MTREDQIKLLKRAALYARLYGEREPGYVGPDAQSLSDAQDLEALARRMEDALDKTTTIHAAGSFGPRLDFNMPVGGTSVMLLYSIGQGWVGTHVSLPHQIYVERIQELLTEHPYMHHIAIAPLHSLEFIEVWNRDQGGWQVMNPELLEELDEVP